MDVELPGRPRPGPLRGALVRGVRIDATSVGAQGWGMNDSSMRAHVRRSAPRGGQVHLTSAQIDALTDELACSGAFLSPPPWGYSDACVGVVDGRYLHLDATPPADVSAAVPAAHIETARIVVEADCSEAAVSLKETAGAIDAVTAAANAASAALDNLNSKMPSNLTFTVDLDADGGPPHVSFSGPCELFASNERIGVEGVVELAKRAQRALHKPIVDEPKPEAA